MILLLDIGNTRIKWALKQNLQTDSFVASGQFVHRDADGSDWSDWVSDLHRYSDQSSVVQVVAVNVAGEAVASQLELYLQVPVTFVASEAGRNGLKNGYGDIRQLGPDRWVAMVGAMQSAPAPLCVVDAGTAVTIDVINAEGQHLGGLILPGLNLMRAALFGDTGDIAANAALPDSDAGEVVGEGTAAAVSLGALHAVSGAIESAIAKLSEQHELDGIRVVLTGGDAAQLMPWLSGLDAEHRPDLVLTGLAEMASGK